MTFDRPAETAGTDTVEQREPVTGESEPEPDQADS
jgi:hypothetical protein